MVGRWVKPSGGGMSYKRQKTHHTNQAQLARLKRQVNALKPEMKCSLQTVVVTNLSSVTGSITYLTNIAQGTDIYSRIGDKIRISSFDINVLLNGGFSALPGGTYFSTGIYLIRDLESNGVIPVVSGTAQSIFTAPGPLQDMVQPNVRDRFKILKRWIVGGAETINGQVSPQRRWHQKINSVTTFHDATSAQTGAGKNAYYIVMMTEDTGNGIDIDVYSQCNFTDT